jgi:enediyne biosynthesis protein E4
MKKMLFLLPVLFLAFNCKTGKEKSGALFTPMSASRTHVDFVNQLTETAQNNIIEYLYFNNGAGVAAGDINNDGLVDLYFTSNQKPNKLYLNKGNLEFEDITLAAGVSGLGDWKTGVTMADVNGDSLLDIYVCQVGQYKSLSGRNQLFINQGNLTFREEAREYGLDFRGFSTQAAFFDYDRDGDLDMYLLNHSVHTSRSYGSSSLRFEHDSLAGDRLYRHDLVNGRHVFRNVTHEAGIYNSQIGYGLGINVADINNDGYPDIYVSNDFHENDYLYINNGNGTFTDQLQESVGHTSRSSMGNDIGDFNNDGLPDIMVLDMLPDDEKMRKQSGGEDDYELFVLKLKYGYYNQLVRNTLQLNLGGGLFSEIGPLAGVSSTDWSWSPLFCDVDNDGWKDLFITSGIFRRANDLDYISFLTGGNRFNPSQDNSNVPDSVLYNKMPLDANHNYIFRNNGDLTFTNKTQDWGLDKRSFSNGCTYADLDNDGDLDLVVNNINNPACILRNNSDKRSDNHFLGVKFTGSGLNTRGIGARVTLFCDGKKQVAEQFPTRGFLSATSDLLHFGVGQANRIDTVIVRWPDGSEQTSTHIPADQVITFDVKNAMKAAQSTKPATEGNRLFSSCKVPGLDYKHTEDEYVDFNREKLIPHSLSGEGPPIAVSDINGDGLEDIFLGGAKGQPAVLFAQQRNGKFVRMDIPLLARDRYADDVDAAFFDADGDGDSDLYIVRGGNELFSGDPKLSDLLLINDGKGNFSGSDLPRISHNGSCVRPCDFDKDGDIDLFIGSRSVPGAYGWPPDQFLLENDGTGHFTAVTRSEGKIEQAGMVTDALWMDYDRDGDPDLVLAGEWMNITVFRNDKGLFTDVTKLAGLDETSGWWNCLEAADVDGDGNTDLIGGNLGLNSLLKASAAEPVEMYLNDFDNNGTLDPVICSWQNGKSYPVASLDELTAQMSYLGKIYPHYSDFGGKTVKDIFDKKTLQQSTLKKAVLFETCVFLNNEKGAFTRLGLPIEAQFSPVRDILVQDVNKDGIPDLALVGNDYLVRPSYGRYDASYGWCLLGNSEKSFETLMPVKSGFIVKGDSRRIVPVTINNKQYILVTANNGNLQLFKLNE